MKRVFSCLLLLLCGLAFLGEAQAAANNSKVLVLPKPVITGGKPLMECLAGRQSNREISGQPLSEQTLSNLLWAAWGINRADGRRTAPTAKNNQEIQLYVVIESGVYLYNAAEPSLVLQVPQDLRSKFTGSPVTLLFAAPFAEMASGMHAGSMYQNAGLFCASEGLANVVKTTGKDALQGVLKLPAGYEVLVVQYVGYPK
ncbi:hypothetical protein FACS1894168_2280 [Deltaproteobacteria bacterium]|nr:hypothetical protein FACS1894168_2280 [Deltaproteobacteria bacterium]